MAKTVIGRIPAQPAQSRDLVAATPADVPAEPVLAGPAGAEHPPHLTLEDEAAQTLAAAALSMRYAPTVEAPLAWAMDLSLLGVRALQAPLDYFMGFAWPSPAR